MSASEENYTSNKNPSLHQKLQYRWVGCKEMCLALICGMVDLCRFIGLLMEKRGLMLGMEHQQGQ
jgi:hypothetical protein